jgi:hypothetical protein
LDSGAWPNRVAFRDSLPDELPASTMKKREDAHDSTEC